MVVLGLSSEPPDDSYGMYVLHPYVLGALFRAGAGYNFGGLVLSVGFSYLAAWISWTLVEKRFLVLKKYFGYNLIGRGNQIVSTNSG